MSRADDSGLSPAQYAAVTDAKPQVLVAAAAGSGKTRLLVASVVRALVEERLPVERLVAVTFTRKAGAELASRVREALEACGRLDLARALDSAMVGTIDSLCRRLVKDRALALGLDPACTVLEAEAAELIKSEAADEAWEVAVLQAGQAELEVLSSHSKRLCGDVIALYDRLRGLGQVAPRIDLPARTPEAEARARLLEAVEGALAVGGAHAKPSASLATDLDRLRDCLAWLNGPEAARSGEIGLETSTGLFPSRKSRVFEEQFGQVRSALHAYRCVLAEGLLSPLAEVVNTLLTAFHRAYATRKAEYGVVDFADLELKARELLSLAERGDSSATALAGSFLLVDEFQDTNELQCTILSGLGADRVLMVGDERQSIYRFRGADVDVFKRRRAALSLAECGGAGSLHRLDVNYRSSAEILAFINGLFSRPGFFGEEFVCLAADPQRVPVRPAGAGPGAGVCSSAPPASVEVVVAERSSRSEDEPGQLVSWRQAEAGALARHVRRLLDEQGWRQRDVVVLLPTQTQVELYRDALSGQGIDVYVVRGKGYYTQEEVTDVVSLLRLILNPHEDLALVSVLRSPLVGVSDDALYLLGRAKGERRAGSLWEVLRGQEVEHLQDADRAALALLQQRVGQIRPKVGRPGLARLIDDCISAFSYDLCLLAAPDGRRRFANVRKFMRLAEEFERATGPDLAAFLAVVRSTGQVGDREGSAPTLGEGEDVVRVMTVHQAKGLEFPVVVLAGLGADAHRPETSTFMVGVDGRVGMFLKGYRNRTYEAHDPSWGPAAELAADESRREQEEDVRLLYVAMTRAQERLVLVGARPTKESLDNSRLGRLVQALGLSALPDKGQVIALPGLSAAVVGVEAVEDEARAAPPQAVHPEAPPLAAGQPRFLELPTLTAQPARVSFSSLAAYHRCPRQYYLERALGLGAAGLGLGARADDGEGHLVESEALLDAGEAHAGREVGILVHKLLEQLARDGERPATSTVSEAAELARTDLGMHLGDQEIDRAVALTLALWDSPIAGRLSLASAEREVPFFYAVSGTLVSGIMDLLCREPDCWLVADYKTNALRGRPVAEVAEPYALQCSVYGLAALRAGAPAVRMDLVFLDDPREPVTARYERADMTALERELTQVTAGLRRADFARQTGTACDSCSVAAVCRNMVGGEAMV